MEDSRTSQLYPDLWRFMSEELKWVIDLPLDI